MGVVRARGSEVGGQKVGKGPFSLPHFMPLAQVGVAAGVIPLQDGL